MYVTHKKIKCRKKQRQYFQKSEFFLLISRHGSMQDLFRELRKKPKAKNKQKKENNHKTSDSCFKPAYKHFPNVDLKIFLLKFSK